MKQLNGGHIKKKQRQSGRGVQRGEREEGGTQRMPQNGCTFGTLRKKPIRAKPNTARKNQQQRQRQRRAWVWQGGEEACKS